MRTRWTWCWLALVALLPLQGVLSVAHEASHDHGGVQACEHQHGEHAPSEEDAPGDGHGECDLCLALAAARYQTIDGDSSGVMALSAPRAGFVDRVESRLIGVASPVPLGARGPPAS